MMILFLKLVKKQILPCGKLKKYYEEMPNVFVGAVYGKYDIKKLVDLIMKNPELSDAKVQIQLHKYIGVL